MTVKLKDLKNLVPEPSYEGGGRYQAIPHYDVLKSLSRKMDTLNFNTYLQRDGAAMMSVVYSGHDDDEDVRPILIVISEHNGRQPVEAFFAVQPIAQTAPYIRVIASKETIRERHQQSADLSAWADQVSSCFEAARRRTAVLKLRKWWESARTTSVTPEAVEKYLSEWVGVVPPRPSRGMFPMPLRGGRERLLFSYGKDAFGLGNTEAGLIAAATDAINYGYAEVNALMRQFGLFLRLGSMAPPDVFVLPK